MKTITIGDKIIGHGNKTFIIALNAFRLELLLFLLIY